MRRWRTRAQQKRRLLALNIAAGLLGVSAVLAAVFTHLSLQFLALGNGLFLAFYASLLGVMTGTLRGRLAAVVSVPLGLTHFWWLLSLSDRIDLPDTVPKLAVITGLVVTSTLSLAWWRWSVLIFGLIGTVLAFAISRELDRDSGFPPAIWCLHTGFILGLWLAARASVRNWPIAPDGHCPRCGYDCRSLAAPQPTTDTPAPAEPPRSTRCPECGTAVPAIITITGSPPASR